MFLCFFFASGLKYSVRLNLCPRPRNNKPVLNFKIHNGVLLLKYTVHKILENECPSFGARYRTDSGYSRLKMSIPTKQHTIRPQTTRYNVILSVFVLDLRSCPPHFIYHTSNQFNLYKVSSDCVFPIQPRKKGKY